MIPAFELMADDLKALGVDTVFGLMSEDICQLVASLDAREVRFISARQESMAVMMAVGYAGASGRIGVVAVGRGPALANAMHGAMAASRGGVPVLMVIGAPPSAIENAHDIGPDNKTLPGRQMLELLGIRTFLPTKPHSVRDALFEAIAEARLGRASALFLPTDVQAGLVDPKTSPPAINTIEAAKLVQSRQASIGLAISVISSSKRPIILAGLGAFRSGAQSTLENLAEKTGALLVNSLKAKDMFHGHPYNLGVIGSSSNSLARRYVEQADCILAVGASLNRFTTSAGDALPSATIIQVDTVRSNIGRYWYADVGIVGDARAVSEQILAGVPKRDSSNKPFHSNEILSNIASFDPSKDFQPVHNSRRADFRLLTTELDKLLPKNRHLVFDGGNQMAAWGYISTPSPADFSAHVADSGSVGLGLGIAIGVARAKPECWTVAFEGDGSLLMTLGELETIVREQLPIIVVVMNDAAYGAEVHFLRAYGQSPAMAKYADVDFAPLAKTLGFEVATIRSIEQLHENAEMLSNPSGPTLLDCKIDGEVIAPFMTEFLPKKALR